MKELASSKVLSTEAKKTDWLLGPVFDLLFIQNGYLLFLFFMFDMFFMDSWISQNWNDVRPRWFWLVVIEAHLMAPYVIILSRRDFREIGRQKKKTFIGIPLLLLAAFIGILFVSIQFKLFKVVGNETWLPIWAIPLIFFEFRHFSAQNYGILSFYRKTIKNLKGSKSDSVLARRADKFYVTFSMMVLLPLCWLFTASGNFRIFELQSYSSPQLSNALLALSCLTFLVYLYVIHKAQTLNLPRLLYSGTIFMQLGLATMISQVYSGIFFIATHCITALAISALALQPINSAQPQRQHGAKGIKKFFTLSTLMAMALLFVCGFTYLFTYKQYLIEPRISCRGTFSVAYGGMTDTGSLLISAIWWGFMLWLYVMHYYYEAILYRNSNPVTEELKQRFSIGKDNH